MSLSLGGGCLASSSAPQDEDAPAAEIDEGLRVAALAKLQAEASERYDAHHDGGGWVAHNAHLELGVRFDDRGVTLQASDHDVLALRTTGMGRLGRVDALADATPRAVRNEVTYGHGSTDEWYVNGPLGLEQGFTLREPPAGDTELAVEIELVGALHAELSADGGCVDIEGAHGESLAYCELHAMDAGGEMLPARMQLEGTRITLVVDDSEAEYPITIDPYVWVKQFELKPNDTEANDWFGAAVAVDGDRAVVGAYLDDGDRNQHGAAGAAYGFARTDHGWIATHEYLGSSSSVAPETGAQCGRSVAISGDMVAVGCPGSDLAASDAGKVLVFDGYVWEITANDAGVADGFGWSIALSGATLIVGAYADDIQGLDAAGSAYVFVRQEGEIVDEFVQQTKLVASDLAPSDNFGYSVAIAGDRAIVGAYRDDNPKGIDAGAAYVFHRSGSAWSQIVKLTGSMSGPSDWFGYSVDIDGNRAIVGAPYEGANNGGAAYLYDYFLFWALDQRVTGSDTANNDNFGLGVTLDDGTAVVSARFDDWGALTDAGSAYVFVESGGAWSQQAKLTASNAATDDQLLAVAISGNVLFAGAPRADVIGTSSGTAYAFERAGSVWSSSKPLTPAHSSHFARSVSISADTAVVGVSSDGFRRPGVYVYDRTGGTWQQSTRLALSEELEHDTNMGDAVSLDGDTLAVGLPGDDMGGPYGRVEVFHRYFGVWYSQALLSSTPLVSHDYFGSSVAVLGDRLVVGAPHAVYAPPELASGAVYVYERTQGAWELEATLATDAASSFLGSAVALSPDRIVVGAPEATIGDVASVGSAHVFANVGDEWVLEEDLLAPDPEFFDHFGISVAISGTTILVGSRGTVYVYTYAAGSWSLQAELTVAGLTEDDGFGRSVAIDGDLAVIGAHAQDDEGSAYVFSRTNGSWTQTATLAPTAGDEYANYGLTVAIDGVTAVVGGRRQPGVGLGVANIYQRVFFPFL